MLNRTLRGRTFYRLALILPWAIPAFVSVFTWRMLYNEKNGILNKLLDGGGIDAVPWLNDPTWAKLSVIAVNVWLGVPFMMVALLGGLQSIPGELYEAAEMDGASALAAVPQHHPARAARGQQHGDPALHHLDLQHVPGDLPADPGRPRRRHRDPGDLRLPALLHRQPPQLLRAPRPGAC